MRFKFCPECGAALTARELGDEGAVPWCDKCATPWFDMFPTAVISLVYDTNGEVLLLHQKYISSEFGNLVSGYVQPGEDAEATARREILEETGLKVQELELVCTKWFPKKEMLMIGFFAKVDNAELHLSSEVDAAEWHSAEEIPALLNPSPTSTARALALKFLRQ